MKRRGPSAAIGVALLVAACGHARPQSAAAPPPTLPEARRAVRPVALPEWYWEPVDVDVRGSTKPIELPAQESAVARVEGATRLWEELGREGRERVCRDGVVVGAAPGGAARHRMGAFYTDLREQRVPSVLTLDALFFAVHLAFERALAEVEELELEPALGALLKKLEARLGAEQRGAGIEVGEGLRLARAVVAVAQVLFGEGKAPADLGLASEIAQEVARVDARAGPATSALLGVTIDYSRLAAPSGAARPGAYRALAWLGAAPLALVGRSEAPGATLGIGAARAQTRAAMLLARVLEREIDPQIHEEHKRIARLLAFLWGPPDDLSPAELAHLASLADARLEDPKNIANVVKVDAVRKKARLRAPRLSDATGVSGAAALSVRLFGGHAPADSIALASLTGRAMGTPLQNAIQNATQSAAGESRRLPSLVDLPAWLGVEEARVVLRESGAGAFTGYDDALARAIAARPKDDSPARHASVYGSLLDALVVWGDPAGARAVASSASERRRIESMLAAWTLLRHDGQPLSRPRNAADKNEKSRADGALPVPGASLPAFVEPEPDVIARLIAATAQLKRGLTAISGLKATSPSLVTIAEVEDILRLALRVAASEVNDEAIAADDQSALAAVPARLARIERRGEAEKEKNDAPQTPLVAHVFSDVQGGRALSTATGAVEPAIMLVREPSTGKVFVAVGAHLAHHEIVEPLAQRTTDATLRARLAATGQAAQDARPLPREAYTTAFRLAP
ncbi:MAG: DUF3160 domain-containing protein [Labilithrix sp.]|nr:DUF3160 domain-containing protein [Labilithrix sp.]